MTATATVIRSRLRSTTVDPAATAPTPPNMSDSPPPLPLCSRISSTSISDTNTWMAMTTMVSTGLGSSRGGPDQDGKVPASATAGHRGHDSGELVGVEAGPADQGAVDVALGKDVGGVARIHRASVLDAHGGAGLLPPATGDQAPEGCTHRLGVLRGGVAPGADGPHRLVGNH